jgi:membrane protein YdbS with pleckstrin-like domain
VSFQADQKLVRLRPRAGRLLLPTLLVGIVAGILTFFESRSLEPWQSIAIYSAAGLLVFFAWMVPLVLQLVAWVEVSTAGVRTRDGLFGQKRREISWHQVSAVEFGRGKRITIFVLGEDPLVLVGLPKSKALAFEMQQLVRGL